MPGFSDFIAESGVNYMAGVAPFPGATARFLALFTTAPADNGTGGVEVSGSGYSRVQIAGTVAATGSWVAGAGSIAMNSNPGWIVAGMTVFDSTLGGTAGGTGAIIGVVSTYIAGSLVLQAPAFHASSGATDTLYFSAFPFTSASSGAEPSTSPASSANNAVITYPQATGTGWGTAVFFAIYDAVSGGNYLGGDYLGSGKWSPFTCTSASPGVLTVTDQVFTNGNNAVVTTKYGGTLPTTGGSWAGLLTVAGVSGSTFNLGVNTTGTGNGQVRPVTTFAIAGSVTPSFSAATLTLTSA